MNWKTRSYLCGPWSRPTYNTPMYYRKFYANRNAHAKNERRLDKWGACPALLLLLLLLYQDEDKTKGPK